MTSEMTTSWAMLMALGAFHGINPGMGWLFAVALGMQERRRGAVLRALVPLGAGHALAVAAARSAWRWRSAPCPARLAALADGRRPRLARRHCGSFVTGIRAGPACAWAWAGSRCGRS